MSMSGRLAPGLKTPDPAGVGLHRAGVGWLHGSLPTAQAWKAVPAFSTSKRGAGWLGLLQFQP